MGTLVSAVILLSLAWGPGERSAVGYGEPARLAALADERVVESSGLVASLRTPGVLWTLNDSGGQVLYATDRAGRALGAYTVPGAEVVDWEDLAIGPGADGWPALYIADIGDNARRRTGAPDAPLPAVYRLPEPAVDPAGGGTDGAPTQRVPAPAERYSFAYPDGPHDAETLLVHPTTGETLVVTKEPSGANGVYRYPGPLDPTASPTLERVGEVDFGAAPIGLLRGATGGAVAPDASRLAVRAYLTAREWDVPPGGTLAESLAGPSRPVAMPLAPQGEAVAYRADGLALLTTSEGSPCPLFELAA